MTHVLGVDGGGTKTLARLCRVEPDGRLSAVGVGQAAGSNPLSVGWDAAKANLHAAITEASSGTPLDAAVLAVAGCGTADAREQLEQWALGQGFAPQLRVVPDTEPLLAETPLGESAIGLIAGTGSSAVARHADGRTEIVGGWGYLIGDGGSGYAIGRAALEWLTTLHDSATPPTPFARELLERLALDNVPHLRTALYRADDPRAWVARLAPTVLAAAEAGDDSADAIVQHAAGELADLVLTAAQRIGPDARPPVRLAGALLTEAPAYRAKVIEELTSNGGWNKGSIAAAPEAATACAQLAAGLL